MATSIVIIVVNRGPNLSPWRFGYANPRRAWVKASDLAFIHGAAVDYQRGDANAQVLYIDASDWYTRPHN